MRLFTAERVAKLYQAGLLTVDEAREIIGKPPLEQEQQQETEPEPEQSETQDEG